MFYATLLALVFGIIVETRSDYFAKLRGWKYVLQLRDVVSEFPTGIAAALATILISTAIVAIVVAIVGNWRHHRKIKSQFEHAPRAYRPSPPEPSESLPPAMCSKCGYDLKANISGVCPECGTPTQPGVADAAGKPS
jgi:predicted Zn-ribbon and HTH transcriptional regulator